MRILPSTGEHRRQEAKRLLILDLFQQRGTTWNRIQELRERWGIEARRQIPPPYPGGLYTPESFGPLPPEEEFGDQEYDQWHSRYREWSADLSTLCEAVVPHDARSSKYWVGSGWDVFLSMCVLYDPPETQLEEFDKKFDWRHSNITPRSGVVMYSPPIVWLRDADQLESTLAESYNELLEALLEMYVHPQGVSSEDALESIRREKPELFERMMQELLDNESRPYIDVKPYHTWDDIKSAFQVLRARQDARPAPGPKNRDKLTAVQCAILHDDHGWRYEAIAKKYGWDPGSNVVSKYIREGRRILADVPPA
jgi:hypothetical protein